MPTRTRILVVVMGTLLALGTAILAQQHSYTQAEIDAGAKLYESSCGGCHGENGDRITGIDFSKATFKTARTDDDLIRIIRNGVPNTGMPGNPFSEAQANTIVAFVRSMPGGRLANASVIGSLTGDPERGKTIVEGKGNCVSCHPTNGVGGNSGPDLAGQAGGRGGRGAAGAAAAGAPQAAGAPPAAGGGGRGGRGGQAGAPRGGAPAAGAPAAGVPAAAAAGGRGGRGAPNPQQLERSLLDPSAEMAAEYRIYQVVTKANVTARGTLLNQDTFSVQMRDNTDKLMSYWKQDLKEYGFLPSPMPSYRNTLTPQEIADVVSYL
ncbi:MAG TPA: c-type cytochrome, partial [Terriglobia bacterium]|nr:c-type cytochrome [Terriglobia bacterium]